jgi:hypothetical protein
VRLRRDGAIIEFITEFGCGIFAGQEGPDRGKLKNLNC